MSPCQVADGLVGCVNTKTHSLMWCSCCKVVGLVPMLPGVESKIQGVALNSLITDIQNVAVIQLWTDV